MCIRDSYDFEARDIRYTVELARDSALSDVVFKAEDVLLPEVTCDAPEDVYKRQRSMMCSIPTLIPRIWSIGWRFRS